MASVRKNLMKNVKFLKINILENSFNKDKSVGLQETLDTKKIMKFAVCVKLCQHNC